jgi:2-phosphoglycerate kinase
MGPNSTAGLVLILCRGIPGVGESPIAFGLAVNAGFRREAEHF